MRIDNVNFKINVLILFMESEIEVTVQTIETLLESLEDDVIISVLLNGAQDNELRDLFSSYECIKYYESDENLGVAGGRNYLLKTEECQNSDFVFILDNDVVPPTDYIRSLATFLGSQEGAGVVGGVVLDIKNCVTYNTLPFHGDKGVFGNKLLKMRSTDIKEFGLRNLVQKKLFHIGTHPDYYYAYFSIRPGIRAFLAKLLRKLRIRIDFDPFLARNDRYLELLSGSTQKYEVTTVAGCSQAFRTDLLGKLGYLHEGFHPYGFEDVDFCIRAKQAGYKNYIDTSTWLYHGTDLRHKERDPYVMLTNDYRCRTILASRVLGKSNYRFTLLKKIISGFLMQAVFLRSGSIRSLRAKYAGFQAGVSIIEGGKPESAGPKKAAVADQKYVDQINDKKFKGENEENIRAYENKYRGERCFIIGNGPSLNEINLNDLDDEITFGVNGIFYKYDEIGFKPTFYVVEDNHVIDDNLARIKRIGYSTKFFPAKYHDLIEVDENTMLLPVDWGFYWKSHPYYSRPRFSTECDQIIYAGQTVTYLNLQLAYYMGFETVYLVGMDFSYQVPPKEEMDGLTITSKTDDANHFHKDYFGKGKKWHDPKLENCELVYEHAKKVFESDGRKIYNASVGGKLEVFERADFKGLLAEPILNS